MRRSVLAGAAVVASMVLLVFAVITSTSDERDRRISGAKSALTNCQQIEVVKAQLRETIRASLLQLPMIQYYRERPGELRSARLSGETSLRRFSPRDCYALPAVRDAGLKRP